MPMIAFGLRLNASMNLCLNLFDVEAYRVRPVSPVKLIKTLPDFL